MTKIYDAHDKAREEGYRDAHERIRKVAVKLNLPFRWSGKTTDKNPVVARIDHGRWIADCECGGAEYVAEGVPFFCHSCGNASTAGAARRVIFPPPEQKREIERELLKLPVLGGYGKGTVKAFTARYNLRNWRAGESIEEVKKKAAGLIKVSASSDTVLNAGEALLDTDVELMQAAAEPSGDAGVSTDVGGEL